MYRDVTKSKKIVKLIEAFKGPILRKTLVEDDPAFNNSLLEKSLIYFTYDANEDDLEHLRDEFKAQFTTELR